MTSNIHYQQPGVKPNYSRFEKELKAIFEHYAEDELNQLVFTRKRMDLAFALHSDRQNCIQWLPITEAQTVLEIGSAYGELSGALADKAKSVFCFDRSREKIALNALRNRQRANLAYYSGDFSWLLEQVSGKKFHTIILSESMHFLSDSGEPASVLQVLVSLLEEDGALYWLPSRPIEQKKGIRRLIPAASLSKSRGSAGDNFCVRIPETKEALDKALRAAGLQNAIFYSLRPDSIFTRVLFLEGWQLNVDSPNRNAWQSKISSVVGSKAAANTWIIEISKNQSGFQPAAQLVYAKFSTGRKKAYKIRTEILRDAQSNYLVRKMPCYPEGTAHCARIAELYTLLKEQFAGTKLAVNTCTQRETWVEFEYIRGKTLRETLIALLEKGDKGGFDRLFTAYVQQLRALAKKEFVRTEAFDTVFGSMPLSEGTFSMDVSDIDLIFDNIICSGHQWVVIDYEWTFAFPIPVDFILYRSIFYFSDGAPGLRERFPGLDEQMYSLAGVGQNRKVFREMDLYFQNAYVGVQGESMGQIPFPGNLLVRGMRKMKRIFQIFTK